MPLTIIVCNVRCFLIDDHRNSTSVSHGCIGIDVSSVNISPRSVSACTSVVGGAWTIFYLHSLLPQKFQRDSASFWSGRAARLDPKIRLPETNKQEQARPATYSLRVHHESSSSFFSGILLFLSCRGRCTHNRGITRM